MKKQGTFVRKSAVAFAAAILLVGVSTSPAFAAVKDLGARSCSGAHPLVQTYTYSSGKTVHVQVGATTKSKTYNNGTNIIHQYYSEGLRSVSASSATTDGSFQPTGNGVTCTS